MLTPRFAYVFMLLTSSGAQRARERLRGGGMTQGGGGSWWLSLVPEPGQGAGEGHPRACMRLSVGGR